VIGLTIYESGTIGAAYPRRSLQGSTAAVRPVRQSTAAARRISAASPGGSGATTLAIASH